MCVAMAIVPRVTAPTWTTATCAATRKPSDTTESVCLCVLPERTTMRAPMNAEVCGAFIHNRHVHQFPRVSRPLPVPDCDRSCLTCSGHEPSSCLSCEAERRRDANGYCVWYSQCSLRSYMDQNGECRPCHESCHRCSGGGEDHCLSCHEMLFLLSEQPTTSSVTGTPVVHSL